MKSARSIIKNLSFCFTFLIVIGCKKEYKVEYFIENSSQRKLLINFQRAVNSPIDTNEINSGQELIFLIEMGEGEKTEDYLNSLTEIPLAFLEITDTEQNIPSCNSAEFECWKKNPPREKDGIGTISLRIREIDFE